MSFGNTTENDLMRFIFNKVTPAWASGDNFYVALHTADPGEAGDQTTNEASSLGAYARATVNRNGTSDFTVTANQVANALLIQYLETTSGSASITHWSVGTAASGAGQIIMSGNFASARTVSSGITAQVKAGSITATLD